MKKFFTRVPLGLVMAGIGVYVPTITKHQLPTFFGGMLAMWGIFLILKGVQGVRDKKKDKDRERPETPPRGLRTDKEIQEALQESTKQFESGKIVFPKKSERS